jgi:hypothetical protein
MSGDAGSASKVRRKEWKGWDGQKRERQTTMYCSKSGKQYGALRDIGISPG